MQRTQLIHPPIHSRNAARRECMHRPYVFSFRRPAPPPPHQTPRTQSPTQPLAPYLAGWLVTPRHWEAHCPQPHRRPRRAHCCCRIGGCGLWVDPRHQPPSPARLAQPVMLAVMTRWQRGRRRRQQRQRRQRPRPETQTQCPRRQGWRGPSLGRRSQGCRRRCRLPVQTGCPLHQPPLRRQLPLMTPLHLLLQLPLQPLLLLLLLLLGTRATTLGWNPAQTAACDGLAARVCSGGRWLVARARSPRRRAAREPPPALTRPRDRANHPRWLWPRPLARRRAAATAAPRRCSHRP
jgi:hypothetical protein